MPDKKFDRSTERTATHCSVSQGVHFLIPATSVVTFDRQSKSLVQRQKRNFEAKYRLRKKWSKRTAIAGIVSERLKKRKSALISSALKSSRYGGQNCWRDQNPIKPVPTEKAPSKSQKLHFRPLFIRTTRDGLKIQSQLRDNSSFFSRGTGRRCFVVFFLKKMFKE